MQIKNEQMVSRRRFLRQSALAAAAFTIVPRFVLGRGFVAPSDKVTLGVIGAGRQAPGLARQFRLLDTVQVVAACDVFAAKLQRLQQQTNEHYAELRGKDNYVACAGYADYNELLQRDDVDGILVVLPDHWHALAAIDAMKAGKDVYCEKPLSHTVKEGRAMVDAARRYGRIVQTGSMQRSWRNFRHACELVRNGYLGEVKKVLVNVGDPAVPYDLPEEAVPAGMDWQRWLGPMPYRPYNSALAPSIPENIWPKWRDYIEFGGGILSDWGAHMFDIAQWGLGMDHTGPVELVPPADPGAKRGLVFRYANGVEMVHEDFGRGWAVRFIGSEGSLDVSREFLDSNPAAIVGKELSATDKPLYRSDNHYQDWIDCMKTRQLPICDVEIGHRTASVCNIANIAYRVRRPLRWDPVKERFAGDGEANKMLHMKYEKPYKLKV